MSDRKMINAVKKALVEIEEEKLHAKAHALIMTKLQKAALAPDKVAMAKCGLCDKIFELRGWPDLTN